MVKFDYHEPRSLAEALSLVNSLVGRARWLAGGTELLPKLKQRALTADHLVNLKRIPELAGISQDGSMTRIGPLTTLEELATSNSVGERFSALPEAAKGVASPNIRRAATIGGNLCQAPNCLYFIHRNLWRLPECHAGGGSVCNAIRGVRRCSAMSPVDTAPALIALGAELEIEGKSKKRVNLESFFTSSGVTTLGKDEMVASIGIPEPPPQSGSAYLKFSCRKTIDYAITSVGVRLVLGRETDHCLEARVALGGMGPIPLRASEAEEILSGERMTSAVLSRVAEVASQAGQPWTDTHASSYYRRHLAKVLVRKALSLAVIRAKAAG